MDCTIAKVSPRQSKWIYYLTTWKHRWKRYWRNTFLWDANFITDVSTTPSQDVDPLMCGGSYMSCGRWISNESLKPIRPNYHLHLLPHILRPPAPPPPPPTPAPAGGCRTAYPPPTATLQPSLPNPMILAAPAAGHRPTYGPNSAGQTTATAGPPASPTSFLLFRSAGDGSPKTLNPEPWTPETLRPPPRPLPATHRRLLPPTYHPSDVNNGGIRETWEKDKGRRQSCGSRVPAQNSEKWKLQSVLSSRRCIGLPLIGLPLMCTVQPSGLRAIAVQAHHVWGGLPCLAAFLVLCGLPQPGTNIKECHTVLIVGHIVKRPLIRGD
jgi:hypothetical protein